MRAVESERTIQQASSQYGAGTSHIDSAACPRVAQESRPTWNSYCAPSRLWAGLGPVAVAQVEGGEIFVASHAKKSSERAKAEAEAEAGVEAKEEA